MQYEEFLFNKYTNLNEANTFFIYLKSSNTTLAFSLPS